MALKQIKNKIVSTQKTGKVTKAMEAVSAVKMRKTQERALKSRPYIRTALRILERIAHSRDGLSHAFMEKRNGGKSLLVIVTSDKGLAGSVNSAVLKLADRFLAERSEVEVIAVGRKALEYANRLGKRVRAEYTNVADDVAPSDIQDMGTVVMEAFAKKEFDEVHVLYQNFLSTFEQKPTVRQVLPLHPTEIVMAMNDIRPKTGKYSEAVEASERAITHVIEPSSELLLDTLIPQLVQILLYHALIESKACEHSARMVAMKNATDKTKEISHMLTLQYNKARQSAITAEVSEITGGIEALKT